MLGTERKIEVNIDSAIVRVSCISRTHTHFNGKLHTPACVTIIHYLEVAGCEQPMISFSPTSNKLIAGKHIPPAQLVVCLSSPCSCRFSLQLRLEAHSVHLLDWGRSLGHHPNNNSQEFALSSKHAFMKVRVYTRHLCLVCGVWWVARLRDPPSRITTAELNPS